MKQWSSGRISFNAGNNIFFDTESVDSNTRYNFHKFNGESFREFIYQNKYCLYQTDEIYLSMICVHQEVCTGIDKVTTNICNNTNQTDKYIDSHTLHPENWKIIALYYYIDFNV